MIKIDGYYYDGCTSIQTPVVICFYPSGEVLIQTDTQEMKTTIDQLTVSSRLGNTRRSLFLANGAKLETDDNAAVDKVSAYFEKNMFFAFIHKLETKWLHALTAIVVTIFFVWGGIEYGVPVAAKWAAKAIPLSMEINIGKQGVETLDKWIFSPSTIAKDDQQRLQSRFNSLISTIEGKYNYQLLLRSSKQMGANALALPGGYIIMTDGLFELAENDEQMLSVLAHEIGHVEYQHGLRSLFQDSMTALFMAGVLGDITSVTSLSVAIPTILVESRYSREFEIEADQYAASFIKEQKMKLEDLTRILTLLENAHNTEVEFDYLSSHPAMSKRIDLIEQKIDK